MQEKAEQPLVSIIVITYNSSAYVIETLESAKEQTYNNIELIVSDDYSNDNTVEICSKWFENNRRRFVNIKIVTFSKNTGVTGNCNRGLNATTGEWLKFIAGDDVLLSNCILDNIQYASTNQKVRLLFSEPASFFDNSLKLLNIEEDGFFSQSVIHYNKTSKEQYNVLLEKNFLFSPSAFIHREVFTVLKAYDESIRGMEDYPFWLKASKYGYSFYYLNKKTIKYRIRSSSITGSPMFYQAMKKTFFKYRFLHLFRRSPFKAFDQLIYYILIPWSLKYEYLKVFYFFSPLYIIRFFQKLTEGIIKKIRDRIK